MIKSFPFVQQQDEKDCGVACLSMILKYFKTDIPIHKLRDLSGTDLEGTSAFGLKRHLKNCLLIVWLFKQIVRSGKKEILSYH